MIAAAVITTDLAARLAEVVGVVDDLLGLDAGDAIAALHAQIDGHAATLVDELVGDDPITAEVVAERVARLVDLDDVDDARSPLGITLGLTRDDPVSQAWAADVLGVSRARVNALVNAGKLALVVDADGTRCVTRSSVAARLDARVPV